MRVKRTAYATRAGDNEIAKLSLEKKKQVIKQLRDDLKKKDKVLDKYAKMIQSLKREYQTVYTKKSKLKDFLRKQEKDRTREEQELIKKQHAKQMDIYSRMIPAQKIYLKIKIQVRLTPYFLLHRAQRNKQQGSAGGKPQPSERSTKSTSS